MKKTIFSFFAASLVFATVSGQNVNNNAPTADQSFAVSSEQFNKDWAEIDKRPLPAWFNEAKFGIFVVWGPYSVPAFSPVRADGYAEWYFNRLNNGSEPLKEFHKKAYGDSNPNMVDLIDKLDGCMFDADQWCDLFERSGAKYVVTTANYHDGFAMYPTKYGVTEGCDNWNSVDLGPKRDVIGELNEAGEKRGLKMGIYFSLFEWYHPLWLTNRDKFVTDHFHPKFKEVVERYKPWSVFFDGDWGMSGEKWRANELAKWLYNESAVKDKVVVNDRWGSSRGRYGDVFESEYGYGKWTSPEHPWQEDRGIGQSYGYNRNEDIDDYNSTDELLEQLSLVTAGGGNLLLCVGPTADGRIPVIMQQRLVDIGKWLKINGESIYGANANPFWPRTFDWGTITSKKDRLYLHIFNPDSKEIVIDGIDGKVVGAKLFTKYGEKLDLKFKNRKGALKVVIPSDIQLISTINVVEVETEGEISYDKRQRESKDGKLEMTARAFSYSSDKVVPVYGGFRDRMYIFGWSNPKDYATAEIVVSKPGVYDVSMTYRAVGKDVGSEVEFSVAGQTLNYKTVELDENADCLFLPKSLGKVKIDKAGVYKIKICPKEGGYWNGFSFQSLIMQKE